MVSITGPLLTINQDPEIQLSTPKELNDYLFRFYLLFFVIVAGILYRLHRKNHHYTDSSSSTWQRSSSLSSRTHVAAFKHAHRGPKSPARVGRGLFVLCCRTLHGLLHIWLHPGGSRVLGLPRDAVEPAFYRLFPPFSRRSRVAHDLNQYRRDTASFSEYILFTSTTLSKNPWIMLGPEPTYLSRHPQT